MPNGRLQSLLDIEDFTRGTDILSGSGGPTREARARLRESLEAGLTLGWQDLDALADTARVVCTFFSGSIAPGRYDRSGVEQEYGIQSVVTRPLVAAVRELESHLGGVFDAVIPVEIGGNNTGQALDAAANLRKPFVDGDYAGRAIPEVTCITPHLAGRSLAPLACCDYYGTRVVVKAAPLNRLTERVGKHLAMASFGSIGCAAFALSGGEVKQLAVPGTLTRSLAVGRAVRQAGERGEDAVLAVLRALGDAWLVFQGEIVERIWENREGYMWGEHVVAGSGRYRGQRLKLWFKNENHMSWLDGDPYVSSPDVVEVVDPRTAEPLVNTYVEKGQEVVVIAIKRGAHFDTVAGIEAMGPRHWGFDVDFTPVERLFS